jgi:hypothetical protein
LNIILCSNKEYYSRWADALEVCKYLAKNNGLTTKSTRVAMHRIIVDGIYES